MIGKGEGRIIDKRYQRRNQEWELINQIRTLHANIILSSISSTKQNREYYLKGNRF